MIINNEIAVDLCDNATIELTNNYFKKHLQNAKTILNGDVFSKLEITNTIISHIYLGCATCSNMLKFININKFTESIKIIKSEGYKPVFVFPNIAERNFNLFKDTVSLLVDLQVEECVVNDYGALYFINNKHMDLKKIFGRQFFKNFRDPRKDFSLIDLNLSELVSPCIATLENKKLFVNMSINNIEIDWLINGIDLAFLNDFIISIYYPLCLVSCGNLCEYASYKKDKCEKFGINYCNYQCSDLVGIVENPSYMGEIVKISNAIYHYPKERLSLTGKQNIRFVLSSQYYKFFEGLI
ncbi:MAG: hypothetical protein LBT30_06245 [Clostridiales bacterium]|jgi:hypothetical protein|nr:hypothetical protein [Clostridiales bacterium]